MQTQHILTALVLVTLLATANAATYYLDPVNGDNSNPGTSEEPWADLASVLDTKYHNPITDGDVLKCRSGYHGILADPQFRNRKNEDYITLEADEGHTPQLGYVNFRESAYWILRGFEISRELVPGEYIASTYLYIEDHPSTAGEPHHITIENNDMYSKRDISDWGIAEWEAFQGGGVKIAGTNITFRNNKISNTQTGLVALYSDNLIEYNTIENFTNDGMKIGGWNNTYQYNIIKNNYGIDSHHKDGIQVGAASGTTRGNLKVIGNFLLAYEDPNQPLKHNFQGIVHFGDGSSIIENSLIANNVIITSNGHGIDMEGANNLKIVNNIVINIRGDDPRLPGITCADNAHSNTIQNNISYSFNSGGTGNNISNNLDLDDYSPEALFVNYLENDLKHKEGSPAIDTGTDVSAFGVIDDLDRNPRPKGQGYDIGAYEFQDGEAPPECVTIEMLMQFIEQWKQGNMEISALIEKIALWKQGCN